MTKKACKVILLISGLLLINDTVYSQGSFELNVGYGFPESINLKIKYGKNIQVGLCQGFFTNDMGLTSLEIFYHFGNKSKLDYQKPWYVMGGFAGTIFIIDFKDDYKILFYPRIGRTFEISKKTGINVDLGPVLPFSQDTRGGYVRLRSCLQEMSAFSSGLLIKIHPSGYVDFERMD